MSDRQRRVLLFYEWNATKTIITINIYILYIHIVYSEYK